MYVKMVAYLLEVRVFDDGEEEGAAVFGLVSDGHGVVSFVSR